MFNKITCGLCLFVASSSAWASFDSETVRENFEFMNVESWDLLGDPNNVVETINPVGGYLVSAIEVVGSLSDGSTNTWASEARIQFSPTLAPTFQSGPLTDTFGYTGVEPVGPTRISVTPFDPAGSLALEFYEEMDEVPDAPDQTWDTIDLRFLESVVTNEFFELNTLPSDGSVTRSSHSHVAGGLDFFEFMLDGSGSWLNIQTIQPSAENPMNTEMAVYDSLGVLVAFDDDGQDPGLGAGYSMLSFGADDPLANTMTPPGTDGPVLPAGTYTLVTGGHDTLWGTEEIGISRIDDIVAGTSAGVYDVQFAYGIVPEPTSLVLLPTAVLAWLFLRRKVN